MKFDDLYALAVGRVVKKYRQEYGWTQAQMEEYAGLSDKFITHLELGKRSPFASSLHKIKHNKKKVFSPTRFDELVNQELLNLEREIDEKGE